MMIFHWRSRSARSRASVREAAHAASRRSLRHEASRRSGSSPAATAAMTAQPGSLSCAQSVNRQCPASSATSAKARSRPSSTSCRPIERRPGVSMTIPPPGRGSSSRWTVVCRPRPSDSRTAPVAIASPPAMALTRVDLPAPDRPSSTAVSPWPGSSASRPAPEGAQTRWTAAPGAAAAIASRSTSARSALVMTTDGRAPLSQARASSRSIRPRSGSGTAGSTTWTTSTLAASTWPSDAPGPTPARTMAVRRGRTARTAVSRTTQSPVQGAAAGSRTAALSRPPLHGSRRSPPAVSTSQTPRSTRQTRPGSPSSSRELRAAAKESSKPSEEREKATEVAPFEERRRPERERSGGRLGEQDLETACHSDGHHQATPLPCSASLAAAPRLTAGPGAGRRIFWTDLVAAKRFFPA